MCEFSHDKSYFKDIKYKDAIIGSRFFIYNFKENTLKSLHQNFEFKTKKTKTIDIPNLKGDLGIYSYNNNYNNNNNNNNYYYYYYYYYNYYNYYIACINKSYGPSIIHDLGQRSQKIEILSFLSLKDHENKEFLKHFNEQIELIAKKFKCTITPFQYSKNPIDEYNKLNEIK